MSELTINLDLLAALRSLSRQNEPDPVQAAVLAEIAGADGISVQVRRDRRYVRERDLYLLNAVTKTRLNIEIPPSEELIGKVLEVKPHMVTIVADAPDPEAPVGPVDFGDSQVDFRDLSERFKGVGVHVCYMVEPRSDQVKGAVKAGATAVMIDCVGYTQARLADEAQAELDQIDNAGRAASKAGLTVIFSRGITYRNIAPLAELGYVDEFLVGHAVCARAVLVGMEQAVREMKGLLRGAVRPQ